MFGKSRSHSPDAYAKAILYLVLAGLALVALVWLISAIRADEKAEELERSNLDTVAAVVRQNTNRIQVQKLSGTVTTVRETSGGPFGIFKGKLIIRQPFTVPYFVDMAQMDLSDYIWDEQAKTLRVRIPPVVPEAPNVDDSRQQVSAQGWVITRDMQHRLQKAVAQGASRQATEESRKPEHLEAARKAAREAIIRNLEAPLRAAGLDQVRVEVVDASAANDERWDVSRSIEEVLDEAAARPR